MEVDQWEKQARRRSKATFWVLMFLWAAVFGFVAGTWHISAAFASVLVLPVFTFFFVGLLLNFFEVLQ